MSKLLIYSIDRRSATLHVTHVLRDHTARSPVEGIMLDPKGRCSKISDFRSPSVAHLRDVSLVSWVRKERRGWWVPLNRRGRVVW